MNEYKELNIYQKMALITSELQTIAKNLTVQTTKSSSYKAVSERDVLDAVKPLEAKYGVFSFPSNRIVLESNLLESESEFQGKVTKKTTFMTRIETIYRFVNVENPSEYIETTTFAEGIDSQDKGSGKAMTYADKYSLLKVYKISTGDDPDTTASESVGYKTKHADKPTYVCADCGATTDAGMAERTKKAFGVYLCKDCGLKRSEAKLAEAKKNKAEKGEMKNA